MLHKRLEVLKEKLSSEAELASRMVGLSVEGLVKRDGRLLEEVVKRLEPEMDRYEVEIEEECINIIALYQPKAVDLRTIVAVLKMNRDLERVGDLAVNISCAARPLLKKPPVKPLLDIPRMAQEALSMLKDALRAFFNKDSHLARMVCERDSLLDALRDQVLRELITYMSSEPSVIEEAMGLIRIARCLERVGDLATNMAEDAYYMVEGKKLKCG